MILVEQHTGIRDLSHENVGGGSNARMKGDDAVPDQRNPTEPYEPSKKEEFNGRSGSIWQNISVFRDFFLAAFSDGYQNNCFCGDVVPPCCDAGSKTGGKGAEENTILGTGQIATSHDVFTSVKDSTTPELRWRRKKPLAVAVGFKYAEDQNGRPIVVTPTSSRNATIDVTGLGRSPPRSPPPLPRLTSGGTVAGLPLIRPSTDNTSRTSSVAFDAKSEKW